MSQYCSYTCQYFPHTVKNPRSMQIVAYTICCQNAELIPTDHYTHCPLSLPGPQSSSQTTSSSSTSGMRPNGYRMSQSPSQARRTNVPGNLSGISPKQNNRYVNVRLGPGHPGRLAILIYNVCAWLHACTCTCTRTYQITLITAYTWYSV